MKYILIILLSLSSCFSYNNLPKFHRMTRVAFKDSFLGDCRGLIVEYECNVTHCNYQVYSSCEFDTIPEARLIKEQDLVEIKASK